MFQPHCLSSVIHESTGTVLMAKSKACEIFVSRLVWLPPDLLKFVHPAEAEDGSLYRTLRWALLPEPSPVRPLALASRACFPPGCWGFSAAAQTFPVPGQPALFGTLWIHIPVIPGTVNAALNTNPLVLFARTYFFSVHIVSVSGLGPVPILLSVNIIIIIYSNSGACFLYHVFVKREMVSCSWILRVG